MGAAKVNGGTAGGAAGGAVKVNYGAVGRQQGVSSNGSAVPALGSNNRLNIQSSIYQLVVRLQAYRCNRSVGWTVGVAVIVWLGSSTVLATGSFSREQSST